MILLMHFTWKIIRQLYRERKHVLTKSYWTWYTEYTAEIIIKYSEVDSVK